MFGVELIKLELLAVPPFLGSLGIQQGSLGKSHGLLKLLLNFSRKGAECIAFSMEASQSSWRTFSTPLGCHPNRRVKGKMPVEAQGTSLTANRRSGNH